MTLFLILALLATAIAVVILVTPLLRYANRSAGSAHSADRPAWRTALVIAVVLPMSALALYASSGRPVAWMMATTAGGEQADSVSRVRASIAELADKLKNEPDNAQGWLLLARSYQGTGLVAESLSAYARASNLMPDDPDLLVEYANVLSRQNGRSLAGHPTELLERALQLEPDNLNALALAGAAALQRGDAVAAQAFWVRLRDLTDVDSPDRERIEALLARARGETVAAPAGVTARTATAPLATFVKGSVTLSPELADRVAGGDTLFVFARPSTGAPMPIAAVRSQAAGWPIHFSLDDQASMGQGPPLSSFEYVDIVARVSHSGSTSAQPGDLEGIAHQVAVGADAIVLVIDRVVGGR